MNHLKIRISMYFIGLFVMTIGIALSVKSNLGVSPVSSIPYTMTCVWGIEMGRATILFHVALVLVQVLLLRRRFRPVQFLQIGVGIVFGCFTTFCNYCVAFLPTPEGFALRLLLMLLSTVFIAAGIFLYLPANLIPLAGEGTMQAVSTITGIEFPKVKIAFDCTMVLVSAATCLIVIHSPGSVGIGTIIAAILVGMVLGVITRLFGAQRDRLLHGGETASSAEAATVQPAPCYVITISREYGSGGREIGKLLAEQLGFRYYDSDLIRMTAQKSGYTPEYVEQNEQSLKKPMLHDFFSWYSAPLDQSDLPKVDQLFHTEAAVIRSAAREGSCVIVGRLANIILKDLPNTYHVFITASLQSEIARVVQRDGLSPSAAAAQVQTVNRERANHCRYFTKTIWGNAENYNLSIRSDDFGCAQTAKLIEAAFRRKFSLAESA